ncbi:GAF domain-containing sensor histidine kinase [Lunatimonas lonarensis]|nr:GAF domain-containing sensor histidine kinase [Lunatimonas lonarensis]
MQAPLPSNELDRLLDLSAYGLDYLELEEQFRDLTALAAKISGAKFSLINIIDTYTQWSVAATGIDPGQVPRDQSICQYTILDEDPLEVQNILEDDRFAGQAFATEESPFKYYWGIPLRTPEGFNIGALCVLDSKPKLIDEEKTEMLKLIANEVVNRLGMVKNIRQLEDSVSQAKEATRKIAHDIRGPLGGILGLSQLIHDKGDKASLGEASEVIGFIFSSSQALLELTDEILLESIRPSKAYRELSSDEYTLPIFGEKLKSLYGVQASQKGVILTVSTNEDNCDRPFAKRQFLQIAGNLISNAIKFTPEGKKVHVSLSLESDSPSKGIRISVKDQGVGMTPEKITEILGGQSDSTKGTAGETGYGFGLPVVRKLVTEQGGSMKIDSKENEYSEFNVWVPL